MSKDGWIHHGFAGHFIASDHCRFHLCTVVGEGRWLVSTVGAYKPPHSTTPGWEEIGWQRLYETMVFRAGARCKRPDCGCEMPEIDGHDLDFGSYNNAGAARLGHEALCVHWDAITEAPSEVDA